VAIRPCRWPLSLTWKGMRLGSPAATPPKRHRRVWLMADATVCVVTLVVIAVIAIATGGFGLANSKERAAQDRCESEVRNRLASPSAAKLSDVKAVTSDLDPDSRDMFPLTLDAPLKGVDHSRIMVWNVSGVVDVPNEIGGMIHDPFTCRAYFVDGTLADTSFFSTTTINKPVQ
jgi:hypothetical protein